MKKSICFTLIIISCTLFGQSHDHEGHSHGDSNYELGLSIGFANLVDEDEKALSTHLHFLRKLGSQGIFEKISVGAGIEYIFTEHTHFSIVGTFSLIPYSNIKFDISPGILITEHDEETEKQFVTHIELTYEFDYHGIGIGPVIGYGFSKADNHFMVGGHIGFGL